MDNTYAYYQEARDMAWRTLIECKINSLPVDLGIIAASYNIEIVPYSRSNIVQLFKPEALSGDGFIAKLNERKVIFINDRIKTLGRRRFTVGHELGHGLLGHPMDEIMTRNSEMDSKTDPHEMQANVVSRDIIAPACVLNALNITTVEQLMTFCNLSRKSSEVRLERLNLLRERNAFFISPLERQVYENFKDFINVNKL